MALRQVLVVGPLAASNAALFAASQTPTSGTALTLTGTQPDVPRRVLLTFGNEVSNRTLTITGTNSDGNPIQEALTIVSGAGGTIATVQDFATITKALPTGGGWTAAITLGTNGVGSSPWKIFDPQISPGNVSFAGVISGTVTWRIEYTYDDPNSNSNTIGGALGNYPAVPNVFAHPVLNNEQANADSATDNPITAWRAVITAGTGSVTVTGIQAGVSNTRLS